MCFEPESMVPELPLAGKAQDPGARGRGVGVLAVGILLLLNQCPTWGPVVSVGTVVLARRW